MAMMPTLFLSHGAPNSVLYDLPFRRFLDGLAATLPRPRAILVASAHYEERGGAAVTADAAPRTIHDFRGFEPELYALRYAAAGDPALAADIVARLAAAGITARLDHQWGLDHGAWTPLLRAYPAADVPVLVLSHDPAASPAWHRTLGAALAGLREEGILVVGSGSITHNLARLRPPIERVGAESWVTEFTGWLGEQLLAGDVDALLDYRARAPHARDNHPTEEHLLPLFTAFGAAGEGWRASRIHASLTWGALAMDAWRFD